MSDRPVRVILDASAIVAFTRGSIDVGETIAEINDEYAAAGLPVLCLVEANRLVADSDRLELLVNHPARCGARSPTRGLASPGGNL